jgi:hypothetical protein
MEKMYTIWALECWDGSIEEKNAAGSCLTKSFARKQEDSSTSHCDSVWISGTYKRDISYILEKLWCKEEVDEFITINPEASKYTFMIYKPYSPDNSDWTRGYLSYIPIAIRREELLRDILDI